MRLTIALTLLLAAGCREQPQSPGAAAPRRATLAAADAILTTAQTLIREGERDRAEAVLAGATETYPDDRELLLAHAELLTGLERHAEAFDLRRRALDAGDPTADVHEKIAESASFLGEWQTAAESLREATKLDAARQSAWASLAVALDELGDRDQARTAMRTAADLNPLDPVPLGWLAQDALDQSDHTTAATRARQAIKLDPDRTAWRLIEARAMTAAGDPEAALTLLLAFDTAQRFEPATLDTIAAAAEAAGRPDVAATTFEQAARAAGSDGSLWATSAEWAERAGDRAAALRAATNGSMLGDENARALLRRLESDN
ncbi:MAG: tetratricopeptide repeat protein [Planctomycetota bacterium]